MQASDEDVATRSSASWSTQCKNVYEAEYKDAVARHQDLVREENRALVEKVEDNNQLLIALREELERRSWAGRRARPA